MYDPSNLPDNIDVMVRKVMDSDNLGVERCHRLAAKAAANGNSWDELTWLAGAVSIVYPALDGAALGYVATELALRANREA
jgi:hypothetical protein